MNPGLHASIWLTGSKSEMKVFLRIFLLCGISSISSSSIRASRLALSCTSSVSAAASNLCFSASCIRITVSPASRSRTSDKIFSMAFMISAWLLDGIMSFRFQMVPGGKMHVRTKDLPVKAFIKYSFHKLAILRSGVIKKKKTTTQILCLCSVFIKCQKKKKKALQRGSSLSYSPARSSPSLAHNGSLRHTAQQDGENADQVSLETTKRSCLTLFHLNLSCPPRQLLIFWERNEMH